MVLFFFFFVFGNGDFFFSLLLGASLHLHAKATSSDPHWLGPWVHVAFVCMSLFCRRSNALKAHHREFG
jgi:hypothetical protein